jgi:uncharacterized protein
MSLTVDLTLSNKCNFNCSYCSIGSEHNKHEKKQVLNIDNIIKFINNIIKNIDSNLTVSFYGGEPTIEYNSINRIFDYYLENNNIQYMLYTNGSDSIKNLNLDNILDNNKVSRRDKLVIQVSYDGLPIHDKDRVKNNIGTSKIVLNSINYLANKVKNNSNIHLCIKSTIGYNDFNDIYDSYLDIYNLAEKYNNSIGNININYGPTLDLNDRPEYVDKENIDNFKNNILKISRHIIKTKKNHFLWLNELKDRPRLCSTGVNLVAVNIDGSVYPCHSFYDATDYDKNLLYGNILDSDILDKIRYYKAFYNDVINYNNMHDDCKTCYASMCRKCNFILTKISKKEDFKDQIVDYKSSINNCLLYREAAKILIATNRLLNKVK